MLKIIQHFIYWKSAGFLQIWYSKRVGMGQAFGLMVTNEFAVLNGNLIDFLFQFLTVIEQYSIITSLRNAVNTWTDRP